MNMSYTQWITLLLTAVFQALIVGTMIRRKLRAVFPIFFTYTVFHAVALVLGVAVVPYCRSYTYFYTYWTMSTLLTGLGFGVLYEVFVNALKPYPAVIDLGKLLFRWAALFLLLVAFITGLVTNGAQPSKIQASVDLLDRSVNLMQCGILLLLLIFEQRLFLSWRNHGMCIALGLGTTAALTLTCSFLQGFYPKYTGLFDTVYGFCYDGILIYWLVALALPEPMRKSAFDAPGRLIIQRWNEELAATPFASAGRELAFAPVDSFIPGVERAVDRVLARKMVE